MLNNKIKQDILKSVKLGVTKFELISAFENLPPNELREIIGFYEIVKKINLTKDSEKLEKIYDFDLSQNDTALLLNEFNIKQKKVFKHHLKKEFFLKSVFRKIGFVLGVLLCFIFFGLAMLFIAPLFGTDIGSIIPNIDIPIINIPNLFAPVQQIQISGIIFGESTNFSNTIITATGATIKSSKLNDNTYSLELQCKDEFTLNFSKEGFVPLHKKINSCMDQELDVIMALMNDFEKIDLNANNIVSDKIVEVELNGEDLVILGTNIVPEEAELSVTGFNPNTQGDMQYFPGELEGIDENGLETAFVSYGFAKIIAQDEKGNNLDFKNGTSAKITFQIDEAQQNNAPNQMPLWYFNETKGIWVQEGIAKKVCANGKCKYVGEMSKVHSWWNADKPAPRISIKFKSFNIWPKKSFGSLVAGLNKDVVFDHLVNAFNDFKNSGGGSEALQKLIDVLSMYSLDYSPQILANLKNLSSEEFAYGALFTILAKYYEGSLGWAHQSVYNHPFFGYKCNLFPYDIYSGWGVNLPFSSSPAIDFFGETVGYYLPAYTVNVFNSAQELPGLRRLAPNEMPLPGDIVVNDEHAGLISENGIGYGVMGSSLEHITENINGWGAWQPENSPYVYWRIDPNQIGSIPEFVTINSGPPLTIVPTGLILASSLNETIKVLDTNWKYGDFIFTEFDNYELVIKSPQGFNSFKINLEDLNKEKTVQVIAPVNLAFLSVNNIPSNPINFNFPSDSIDVNGFSLENCKLWGNDVLKISSCITNFDSFTGLFSKDALSFTNSLNINVKDKAKILLNIAKHYNYIDPCYDSFPFDYYAGIACIKVVDKNKEILAEYNLENILNKNLRDYDLTFVLRNLAQYYADANYCVPIPDEDQRNACFARTPAPEQLDNNTNINDIIEDMKKINLIDCKFDEKYSSPLKDDQGNYWIKEIDGSSVYAIKVAGKEIDCVGETKMKIIDGNIVPCISEVDIDDGCVLERKKVYTLNNSKENYVKQNKYERSKIDVIYKQNEVDFIDINGNIWFMVDEEGYPKTLRLNSGLEFIEKQEIFDLRDKENLTITKVIKVKPSKNLYWVILESPLHKVYTDYVNDGYTRGRMCYNVDHTYHAPIQNTSTAGFGSTSYYGLYGEATSIFAKDYNGQTITKLKTKVGCSQDYDSTPFEQGDSVSATMWPPDFVAEGKYFAADEYNTLLVLNSNTLLEYTKDSNDIEYPSAKTIVE